jgi:hypothetical protein
MLITSEYKHNLNWHKCPQNTWYRFLELSFEADFLAGLEGVYMIWHGGDHPAVVCVGQGNIKEELVKRQSDLEVLKFQDKGLFVSWAEVCSFYREGAQRYLMNLWQPKLSEAHLNFLPIKVNSPWE